MRAMVLIFAFGVGTGCAHRVAVESEPPGASVYLNNVQIGTTPLSFDEPGGNPSKIELRLEKNGFAPKNTVLMPVDSSLGCFIAAPWRAKLPKQLFFRLYPEDEAP